MWLKIGKTFLITLLIVGALRAGFGALLGLGWLGGFNSLDWMIQVVVVAWIITFFAARVAGWIGRRELVDMAYFAIVAAVLAVFSLWAADRWGLITFSKGTFEVLIIGILVGLYLVPRLEAWKKEGDSREHIN